MPAQNLAVRHPYRWLVPFAVLVLALTAASAPSPGDGALARLSREYLDHHFAAEPVAATEAGDHRFDDRLPDYSRRAIEAEIVSLRGFRRRLEAIGPWSLNREARQDRDILLNAVETRLFTLDTLRVWQTDPLVYTRAVGDGVRSLLARDFAPLPERLRHAVARMRAIPGLIDAAKANLVDPPRVHLETARLQNQGAIAFVEDEVPVLAAGAPADLLAEVKTAADGAAVALRAYQRFLEEDLGLRAHGDYRLGTVNYRRKMQLVLNAPVDPDEFYFRALGEFERVSEEMFALAFELHGEIYPDHRHGAHTPGVRRLIVREVLHQIAQDRPAPDEMLAACRASVDSLTAFVREKDLLSLEGLSPLAVEWTPAFARGVAVAGLEAPGPLDAGQRAFFHVSPVPADWPPQEADSYLREYNHSMLRILSLHEAMPGHYVQLCRANRFPSVIRAVFGNGAMIEGWAVYAERMMLDAGYGGGDRRLRLQQLKFYMRTVLNALLDQRVHVMGIEEDEAMDLLVEKGFQEKSEARGKWTRARLTSVQLSTYLAGYLEIVDLQAAVREAQGDTFDLKEFHEAVLSHGSPPVRFIRESLLGEGAP